MTKSQIHGWVVKNHTPQLTTWGIIIVRKSNQGNQYSSSNQKNVIQGQRPDKENRHTQQRTTKTTQTKQQK